jgi:hypothetical protein
MEFVFSLEQQQKLQQLVEFYFKLKNVILYYEETDANSKYNAQIWQELRSSFDHFMRSFSSIGAKENNESYVLKNFDKAYGHLYRAYYDAAEGTIFSLKKKLISTFASYTPSQLMQVIPDYVNDRMLVEHMNNDMALYRSRKDIVTAETSDFESLSNTISQLKVIYDKHCKALPLLNDLAKEGKQNTVKGIVIGLVIALVGALVGVLVGRLL